MTKKHQPREVILSEDGSTTLYIPSLQEHYHSIHGAIQESVHIYLNNGLQYLYEKNHFKKISIFEVGLGTGLNCWLTAEWARGKNLSIDYQAIEPYPIDVQEVSQLNFTQDKSEDSQRTFNHIHTADWEKEVELEPYFILKKCNKKIVEWKPDRAFDLVYFDAFAPDVQPDLWTQPIFEKLYHSTVKTGILLTYCAKGAVKRTLLHSGWQVERLPGPPGKREITRAFKLDE